MINPCALGNSDRSVNALQMNADGPLEGVDLADPELYATGDPHSLWRLLRRERPVHWNAESDGPGFWAVTRYADAMQVYRDTETFSSERGNVLSPYRGRPDPAAGKIPIVTDPPRHSKQRALINRGFTPARVAGARGTLVELLRTRILEAVERPQVDLVTEVIAAMPVAVIAEMLGVPEVDRPRMVTLTARAFGAHDPDFQSGASSRATAALAHGEILGYYAALVERRRAEPADDLVTHLLNADVDGTPLSAEEVTLTCDMLVLAGNETSKHAAAGGVLALAERPQAWEALKRDRGLLPTAVEEVLRWTSPGMHVLRTATRDVEIRGRLVREGESVTVWNPSANRDEEAFDDSNRFDVARPQNRHLTFGGGRHFCLGAALARLEITVLLEQLLDLVDVVEPAGPPERLRSNLVGGLKRLPVRLVPAG
jgi:cytochrome P450